MPKYFDRLRSFLELLKKRRVTADVVRVCVT